MGRLQNNLAELTARIEPRNFNYTLDIKLNSDMSNDDLDCTASNKKTEQSIAHNNENVSMPECVASALHAVTNNENETVICSDELAIGSGPMLSGYMNHRGTNICMPGTTSSNLVLSITRLLAPSAERDQYESDP
ncbi:hypothetical protein EVAR_79825_1 [Eumeta japonica]|uniref:Uncharacterized protein n=1 Tax=Eumeta variegata TaxID=151549 RepID=A0A4C1WQE3_EUMVA|nr:hypothetical protein EVAR_79825_1 [Eumeta japonica]